MLLSFSPHPSPLLLSLPSTSASKPHARLRRFQASASTSASPSPELLGKSALRRISDKLRSLGYIEATPEVPASSSSPGASTAAGPSSPGEIFVPTPAQLPRHRVGSTLDPSWATGDGESGSAARRRRRGRGSDAAGSASAPPSAAELALPRDELRRLQGIGIRVRKRLKLGKAGVTEGIVNGIHERWRNMEVVKVRCEDVWAMNMKRTHEILERKTGGLVIWRSGSTIILYRGTNYKYPYFHHSERLDGFLDEESSEQSSSEDEDEDLGIESVKLGSCAEEDDASSQHDSSHEESSENPVTECAEQRGKGEAKDQTLGHLDRSLSRQKDTTRLISSTKRLVFDPQEVNLDIRTGAPNKQHVRLHVNTDADRPSKVGPRVRSSLVAGVGSPNKFRLQLPGEVKLADEADKLLDGLGPRFSGWWGYNPLPVDADLLPAIVPGYRRPFRLLPSGVPPKLTDREMTILRRLSHPLPFHYALGRSSNLQGLAASMIKLWERCEVAKIAIKRDAQNADTELITEELKDLTGGTLLSRDKESIVLYRGKDFLPPAVSLAIEKRRKLGSSTFYEPKPKIEESMPTQDDSVLKVSSNVLVHIHGEELSITKNDTESLSTVAQNIETRLSQAIAEKEKAEKLLEELENASQPSKAEAREAISEEERYMLRKVGLKMKQFLLLGRYSPQPHTAHFCSEHNLFYFRKWKLVRASAYKQLDYPFCRRGVFDGTIENMHLHWKYRELVKIICKEHRLKDVKYAARTLEAESGGILVAVEKSLKVHVLKLSKNIDYLKDQMNSSYYNRIMDGPSVNSGTLQQQNEEVHEVAPMSSEPEVEGTSAEIETDRTLNLTKSGVPLDAMQSKVCFDKLEDDSSATTGPCLSGSSSAVAVSVNNLIRHQNQHSSTVTFSPDSHHDGDSKDVNGPKSSDVKSASILPSRATPLSNQERLVLRKQALKMKKRPVLSIGRNNVITGVAKTIQTHFKKHPLAIVNIKNRADGTPIQQLISELEEATGSVLVSRETNKVILYRGWGAVATQKSSKENSTDAEEKEVMSPQLLEAIRLECGLLPASQDT
ncbi:hypothetical protein U9M48_032846 [Paspalum notatum var. saurae]|uniref:CRM domain-containing protein n=1 Tax=Paspalum notatum var. saurae TaxID=547442 RepID=A0AAQ3U656_PASNO